MCVLIFSTTFVCNISHSKMNSATHYRKCTCLYVKCPLRLSDLKKKKTWIFPTDFLKILKHYILWQDVQRQLSFSRQPDKQNDKPESLFAILRTRLKKQKFATVTPVFNFISLFIWVSITHLLKKWWKSFENARMHDQNFTNCKLAL